MLVLHRGARPGVCGASPFRCSCIGGSATASCSSTPARASASPKDLIGKRIGVKQFQATAIVWMRGILEHEYGVPAKSIDLVLRARRDRRVHAAARPDDPSAARRQDGGGHAGGRRARRGAASRPDQAAGAEGPARGAAVPELQGRGNRLLQEDRHLPDHARARHQARDRRAPSLGADQHVSTPSTRPRRSP